MRRLPIAVSAALVVLGCHAEKRGIAGAPCAASSDCEARLRCVSGVCVDIDQLEAEDRRAHEEMMAVLKQLKEEQAKLERKKAELDVQLDKVMDDAERARLLTPIQANDAEIAAHDVAKPALEVQRTSAPRDGQ